MKYQFSFRQVLMLAVCGLLCVTLLIVILFGQLFMERVFITQKQTELIAAFNSLYDHGIDDQELLEKLETSNLLITAVKVDTREILYSTRPIMSNEEYWSAELTLSEVFDALEEAGEENYYVTATEDYRDFTSATNVVINRWITLAGLLKDDVAVTIETASQPISEVASLALSFFILVSMGAIVIGIVLMMWLSPKLSAPVYEMSRAAKLMSNQDFSIKCNTQVAVEEYAELAESINRMSDEMQKYVSDLEEANANLKKDIVEKERLEQARKTLFSNLSHDLKTPIAIISGYAEGLKGGMAQTPGDIQDYCEVISDEADRMQNIIVRMLELNRLQSGSIPLEFESFDICETMDYLISTFSLYAENRTVSVEKDYPESLYVYSDYTSVEQTLTNLLQNAISHNIDGGRIKISISVSGQQILLSMFNTCEPISKDELPKLWDSFYRVDRSRTRSGGESGLGLAIVKGNMELLEQPYGVRLEPGGIVFWLKLPLEQ